MIAHSLTDPGAGLLGHTDLVDEARAWATRQGDLETSMAAASLEGYGALMACRWDHAREVHEQQLDLALRLGREREADEARRWIGQALTWGATPVAAAIARVEELQSEASGRFAKAFLVSRLALLHAIAGHRDEAAGLLADSTALVRELGIPWATQLASVAVWLYLGELPETIEAAREVIAHMRAVGDASTGSTVAGWLALALVRAGAIEEAASAVDESRTTGPPDDLSTQMGWRTAAAAVALARGDPGTAMRLASEAVTIARQTDAAVDIAQALMVLGEALGVSGRDEEARAALGEAEKIARRRGWQQGQAQIEEIREGLVARTRLSPSAGRATSGVTSWAADAQRLTDGGR